MGLHFSTPTLRELKIRAGTRDGLGLSPHDTDKKKGARSPLLHHCMSRAIDSLLSLERVLVILFR